MKYLKWIAVLAILWPGLANAKFSTMETLSSSCEKPLGSQGLAHCMGMVSAAVEVLEWGSINGKKACFPKTGLVLRDFVNIVKKWIETHPRTTHPSGTVAAITAISGAFPCPNKVHP